jgi:hypothetical protein
MSLQLLLLMIPELFPRGAAVMFARGDTGLEVNGAHVHGVEGILALEGRVRDEAGVYGDEGAEVGYGADAEDNGAVAEVV